MQRRKNVNRGAQRKGCQASDVIAALLDVAEAKRQDARYEKAEALIKSLRFVGQSRLEAADAVLWEKLVVWARSHGMQWEQHQIDMADLAAMHGDRNLDRVRASLQRISETKVRWDIVDEDGSRGGEQSLLLVQDVSSLRSGTATCVYTIPPAVRRVTLRPGVYAKLELAAISQFRCRYTIRLYEKLAVHAEIGERHKEPWTVAPEELAEMVGWCPKNGFSYGTFKRDVLLPMIADMRRHVTRFQLEGPDGGFHEEPGPGRGRPVIRLDFKVSKAKKAFRETKAGRLSASLHGGWHQRPDPRHPKHWMPSNLAIGRAATLSDRSEVELSEAWRAALDRAVADPEGDVERDLTGYELFAAMSEGGADVAFETWFSAADPYGPLNTIRIPVKQPQPEPEAASAAPAALSSDQRFEETKARVIKSAEHLLWTLEGWDIDPAFGTKSRKPDYIFVAYCDEEIDPWIWLSSEWMPQECRSASRQLSAALKVMLRMQDSQRRSTLRNLGQAVLVWDMAQLAKISRAVLANAHRIPAVAPPPVRYQGRSWTPLTEANAGEFSSLRPRTGVIGT